MADDVIQLDLTLSVTEVPQANNLSLFVRLMEEIDRGSTDVAALATKLAVDERTIQYYVDFGRWLHMLTTPAPGTVGFTETGQSFAESVAARGRLFSSAMFARKLVKTVQALKRDSIDEDDLETLDTRTACLKAIRGMTDLSQATAQRRASGLAHMLDAAHQPSRVDWSTGQPRPEFKRKLEYEGRSFVMALGARQFVGNRELRIGFPRQVRAFIDNDGHGMSARVWKRASWDLADSGATWFGALPVNPSTVEVVTRGGRDLRRFLVMVSPHVALMLAAITFRDSLGRPSVRLTRDMYGIRVWEHDREIGTPLSVVHRIAVEMGLVPTTELPPTLQSEGDLAVSGDDADLVETLAAAGFLRPRDTTYEPAPGIDAELRDSREDAASVAELLSPAYEAVRIVLRGE